MRKTRIVTYCNQLTQYVRSLTNRKDLLNVEYGMELPQEYLDRIDEIMAGTITEMEKFVARIMPQDNE